MNDAVRASSTLSHDEQRWRDGESETDGAEAGDRVRDYSLAAVERGAAPRPQSAPAARSGLRYPAGIGGKGFSRA